MTQTQGVKKQPKPTADGVPAAAENLSRLIDLTVVKQANEEVKTVHLFGNFYRCNWWVVDPGKESMFVRTGRIIKSRFLRVTRTESGVNIEEVHTPAVR